MSTLNENKRKLTSIRGMGAALVGFAGWIILYVVFGLIEPNIFTTNNMLDVYKRQDPPGPRCCRKECAGTRHG